MEEEKRGNLGMVGKGRNPPKLADFKWSRLARLFRESAKE
jgi:hypothetical protein